MIRVVQGLAIAVALLAVPGGAHAEDGKAIDKTYQACLDKGGNGEDMANCAYEATDAWAKIVAQNFKAAVAAAPNEDAKKALRQSQRAWRRYRDADLDYRGQAWSFGDGFDLKTVLADNGLALVKARAQLLQSYAAPFGE